MAPPIGHNIPRDQIPAEWGLYRVVAEDNDPAVLEESDVREFLQFFAIPMTLNSPCHQFRSVVSLLRAMLARQGIYTREDQRDDFIRHGIASSLKCVQAIGSDPRRLDAADIQGLSSYLGADATALIEHMQADQNDLRWRFHRILDGSRKFHDDPRYRMMIDELALLVPAIFGQFNHQFGQDTVLPIPPEGVLTVSDRVPVSGGDAEASFLPESATIRIGAEYLMRSGMRSVVHELNHLWLHTTLGNTETYRRVPEWFREGLAVFAAGQLTDKMAAIFPNRAPRVLARQIDLLEKFEDGNTGVAYFAAGQAIALLVEIFGTEAIVEILTALRMGIAFEDALSFLLYTDDGTEQLHTLVQASVISAVSRAEENAYVHTLAIVMRGAPAAFSLEEYPQLGPLRYAVHAMSTADRLGVETFRTAAATFLQHYPNSVYGLPMHYFKGLAEMALDNRHAAVEDFEVARKVPSGFDQRARYYHALLLAPDGAAGIPLLKHAALELTDLAASQLCWQEIQRRSAPRL